MKLLTLLISSFCLLSAMESEKEFSINTEYEKNGSDCRYFNKISIIVKRGEEGVYKNNEEIFQDDLEKLATMKNIPDHTYEIQETETGKQYLKFTEGGKILNELKNITLFKHLPEVESSIAYNISYIGYINKHNIENMKLISQTDSMFSHRILDEKETKETKETPIVEPNILYIKKLSGTVQRNGHRYLPNNNIKYFIYDTSYSQECDQFRYLNPYSQQVEPFNENVRFNYVDTCRKVCLKNEKGLPFENNDFPGQGSSGEAPRTLEILQQRIKGFFPIANQYF